MHTGRRFRGDDVFAGVIEKGGAARLKILTTVCRAALTSPGM
jgi:hypothetical protein